jgi:hypothetical protein
VAGQASHPPKKSMLRTLKSLNVATEGLKTGGTQQQEYVPPQTTIQPTQAKQGELSQTTMQPTQTKMAQPKEKAPSQEVIPIPLQATRRKVMLQQRMQLKAVQLRHLCCRQGFD